MREITFDNLNFADACELMSGDIERVGETEVCEIQKGLQSFVLIKKKKDIIQILAKNPREIETIETLKYVKDIECTVGVNESSTSPLEPVFTTCDFTSIDHGETLMIKIYPWSSIVVHRYPYVIEEDSVKLYMTIGKKKPKYLRIHRNFKDIFQEAFKSKVRRKLEELLTATSR